MRLILTILEYIFLPLLAILASFYLKRKKKSTPMTLEEFLEDLNIDIQIISVLGLLLYGLNCSIHNEANNTGIYFLSIGLIIAFLLCYIITLHIQFRPADKFTRHGKPNFFGVRNGIYKGSSWFVVILITSVITGLLFKKIIHMQWHDKVFSTSDFWLFICFVCAGLIFMFLAPYIFFFCLNKICVNFLSGTKALENTYGNAFKNEFENQNMEDLLKSYNLVIATTRSKDAQLIGFFQRMAETYEKKGDYDTAEDYLDRTIDLLDNEKVNKSIEYRIDGHLEKYDFYKRNGFDKKAKEQMALIKRIFAGNPYLDISL